MTERRYRAPAIFQTADMCAKCTELDFKITHYGQMATRITDAATLDGSPD